MDNNLKDNLNILQNELNQKLCFLDESRTNTIRITFPDRIINGFAKLTKGNCFLKLCKETFTDLITHDGRIHPDKHKNSFLLPIGKNNYRDTINNLYNAIKKDNKINPNEVSIKKTNYKHNQKIYKNTLYFFLCSN